MATAQRQPATGLVDNPDELAPAQGEFFAAVRLAQRFARRHDADYDRPAIGGDRHPAREPLRFRAVQSAAFPVAAVESAERVEDGDGLRYFLDVSFMGLTGPSGALPQHYTTLAVTRLRQRDRALADFFDLFNHRLLSLYYRAWARACPAVQAEDAGFDYAANPMTRALNAMAGQPRSRSDERVLYYAGQYARSCRSSTSLEHLVADWLGRPVTVETFVGQWLPLRDRDRVRLGRAGRASGMRLGEGLISGRRFWDVQSRIRLHLGPMSDQEFEALLPGNNGHEELRHLLRAFVPAHLDVELCIRITGGEGPPRRLGNGAALGRTAWLGSAGAGDRCARVRMDTC